MILLTKRGVALTLPASPSPELCHGKQAVGWKRSCGLSPIHLSPMQVPAKH